MSEADRAIRQVRQKQSFVGLAMAAFSGAFNDDTAFGAGRWVNNQLDIVEDAAGAPKGSKDVRNNWISKDSKPAFDVFPAAVGVFVGDFGVSTERVTKIITQCGQLVLEQDTRVLVRQPLLTVPSGIGFATGIGVTGELPAEVADAADAVAATQHYVEQFGPVVAQGLFALPENVIFEKTKELKAYIELEGAALTYLRAIATEIPAYGARIGLVVHGAVELSIGASL